MTGTQKILYEVFQTKLDAWTKKPRPHASNWQGESIIANPEYFHKFSTFRSKEWDEYILARDEFLISFLPAVH